MKRTKAIGCKGLAALVGATVIGVPAATALAGADCSFAVDDGTSETSVGLTDGGLIVGGVPFDADFLGCSQVSQVRVDWGGLAAGPGAPAQIIIQNDPNNDGDPNDITGNLACVDVTVQTAELGTFDVYEIDPPVAVSGIFFVSAAIEHEAGDFPLGLDQDSNNGVAWTNFDVADSCDPWADGAGAPLDGLGIPGNWAIQIGEGAEAGADCPEDIDGDDTVGVPDLLDLLSQWGGPGSADFDGSGDVGVPDLLQLLGAWGECPPGGPQGACGLLTTGDCCSANNSQFCNDQTCCETVCAIDSFCCDTAWDQSCADIASDECALCTAPPNDNCDQAQEVGLGMFDYSTINSNTDGNPLPPLCALENDTLGFGKDVWFCYTHKDPDGPVTASICDLDYDGRMAVYEDCSTCPPPNSNIVGCNDDGCGDVGGGSIVAFNAVQGETYLIRVGGWSPDVPGNASEGNGTLTMELGGTPPSPGGNIFDPISLNIGETVGWDSTDNPSSANVPDCGEGLPNGPTVFFQVTGDGTTLTASTCTTALEVDTSMSIVCGEVGQLACVGANDDNFGNVDCFDNNAGVGGSEVSWCAADGQTYIIAVWASNGGTGELALTSDGTPCDDPPSCVPTGACCLPDGSCVEVLPEECGDDSDFFFSCTCSDVTCIDSGDDAAYQYDDGTSEFDLGAATPPADTVWFQRFAAKNGADTITSISTTFGSAGDPDIGVKAGDFFGWAIFNGTGSGDPADVITPPLATGSGTIDAGSIETDVLQTVVLPKPVDVEGEFWVAFWVNQELDGGVIPMDGPGGDNPDPDSVDPCNEVWGIIADLGTYDPNAGLPGAIDLSGVGFDGVLLIRADNQ